MILAATVVFLVCFTCLVYIYGGYLFLLKLLATLMPHWGLERPSNAPIHPLITVYLSALNEEDKIDSRLDNIFDTTYPLDKLEVIVVSDGSTDRTVDAVQNYIDRHKNLALRLIDLKKNVGQAYAQNLVASKAKGDILISTDADTRFTESTLENLSDPFGDKRVGAAGGVISYQTVQNEKGMIANTYNQYRSMETQLRHYETKLGILVKTDGPCTAYRKNIWEPIEGFEDVDQIITLLARKHGFVAVQAEDAICFDVANSSARQDIKQRARMTRKALLSTFYRWRLVDIVKHPLFSFALFSHKVVRFFSPVFFLLLLISGLLLTFTYDWLLLLVSLALVTLILMYGLNRPLFKKVTSMTSAFITAQIGFGLGLIQWLGGNRTGHYTPTRKVH